MKFYLPFLCLAAVVLSASCGCESRRTATQEFKPRFAHEVGFLQFDGLPEHIRRGDPEFLVEFIQVIEQSKHVDAVYPVSDGYLLCRLSDEHRKALCNGLRMRRVAPEQGVHLGALPPAGGVIAYNDDITKPNASFLDTSVIYAFITRWDAGRLECADLIGNNPVECSIECLAAKTEDYLQWRRWRSWGDE